MIDRVVRKDGMSGWLREAGSWMSMGVGGSRGAGCTDFYRGRGGSGDSADGAAGMGLGSVVGMSMSKSATGDS